MVEEATDVSPPTEKAANPQTVKADGKSDSSYEYLLKYKSQPDAKEKRNVFLKSVKRWWRYMTQPKDGMLVVWGLVVCLWLVLFFRLQGEDGDFLDKIKFSAWLALILLGVYVAIGLFAYHLLPGIEAWFAADSSRGNWCAVIFLSAIIIGSIVSMVYERRADWKFIVLLIILSTVDIFFIWTLCN